MGLTVVFSFTDERFMVDERRRKTRTIRSPQEARRRIIQGKKKAFKVVQVTTRGIYQGERRAHLVAETPARTCRVLISFT